MSESGLAMLESVTARVAAWRRRHRAKSGDVQRYQVVFDGAVIADLETRTPQALDDELGAAAWEIAQGLSRPATCDVIALSAEGVELARLPMRVMPARAADAPSADMGTVVKVLLDNNAQLMAMCKDLIGSVTVQLKEVSAITTELAKSTAKRAREAEAEAATATATALDAVQTVATSNGGRKEVRERGEDFIEDMARAHFGVPRAANEEDNDKAAE